MAKAKKASMKMTKVKNGSSRAKKSSGVVGSSIARKRAKTRKK